MNIFTQRTKEKTRQVSTISNVMPGNWPGYPPPSPRDDLQWNTMVTYHDVNLQKLEVCPESTWLLFTISYETGFLVCLFFFFFWWGGWPRELPWWLSGKESTCQCKRHGSIPDLGRFHVPWSNKSMHRNYWACAPEPRSCSYWRLHVLEPLFCNKRNHHSERPTHHN